MNRKKYQNVEWFVGVVEDISDPLKLGRIRIRSLGWHTENKTAIPTESLPWAMVSQPITSAASSGIGHSPTGILPGTWVVGFFSDGGNGQQPVVTGTLAGSPVDKPNSQLGFSDPSGKFPRPEYLGESGVNRLCRNESIDKTIVQKKKDGLDKNVSTSSGKVWSEPKTPYAAVYPKNHVYESESGHIQEFDDTPGKERVHLYHKSGTFEEIHPNGTQVQKIKKDSYEIILGDKYIHIKGDCNLTIDSDSNILIKGDVKLKIEGDVTEEIDGDVNRTISGNLTETIAGNHTKTVSGESAITSSTYSVKAGRIDLN